LYEARTTQRHDCSSGVKSIRHHFLDSKQRPPIASVVSLKVYDHAEDA